MVETGQTAPALSLMTDQGAFTLSEHLGKNVIIFFFPKADTSGDRIARSLDRLIHVRVTADVVTGAQAQFLIGEFAPQADVQDRFENRFDLGINSSLLADKCIVH